MSEPTVQATDLVVTLASARRRVVDEVSITINPGQCLGLVGESGSGKSVTARALLGIPPEGMAVQGVLSVGGTRLDLGDREAMRRWRSAEVGVIFQDPAAIMDPTRTVGDFVTEVLVHERGVAKALAHEQAADLLTSMGLEDAAALLSRYPHEFSGGQLQRICIAAALLPEPRLIIADEATTALDTSSQALVIALLDRARHERGLSMLFITHNLELALAFCDRIAVAYAGKVVELGEAETIAARAHHPYTQALLRSRPDPARRRANLLAIAGQPPGLDVALSGCVFRERCPRAAEDCLTSPEWTPTGTDTGFACFHPLTLAEGEEGSDAR